MVSWLCLIFWYVGRMGLYHIVSSQYLSPKFSPIGVSYFMGDPQFIPTMTKGPPFMLIITNIIPGCSNWKYQEIPIVGEQSHDIAFFLLLNSCFFGWIPNLMCHGSPWHPGHLWRSAPGASGSPPPPAASASPASSRSSRRRAAAGGSRERPWSLACWEHGGTGGRFDTWTDCSCNGKLLNIYIHTYVHTYIPYHTIPYHTIPYHTIPYHYITLHYITLHYITYIHIIIYIHI